VVHLLQLPVSADTLLPVIYTQLFGYSLNFDAPRHEICAVLEGSF